MPPGIIVLSLLTLLSADSKWVNPLLQDLVMEEWSISELQDYLNKQSFRVYFITPVITVVSIVVSICNPSYASLGVWFWFYCIYILCTLTYLFWLRYKKKLVDKYQVSIAKWALELRKELPDQCHERLINMVCKLQATKSLGFQDILMYFAVSNGMLGIVLCGNYYLGFRDSWIHSASILGLFLCGIYGLRVIRELKVSMEQPPDDDIVSSDDGELKVSMEQQPPDDELKVNMEQQPPDDYGKQRQFFSRRLADLGVPMPPGMVLKKSTRYLIPILEDLVVEERKIIVTLQQKYLNRNAFIAFVMMPVIFVVIVVVSICNPSYASLGFGLWFGCIYFICTLTYLVWLTYKEKLLENYRLKIAKCALELRKELPTVEADNVEADQCANDLINRLCYRATIPLNISYGWIYSAVLVGILGIVFWEITIGMPTSVPPLSILLQIL